jgi:hypothetical protein
MSKVAGHWLGEGWDAEFVVDVRLKFIDKQKTPASLPGFCIVETA